jgi:protoporphyrinogen oxidase
MVANPTGTVWLGLEFFCKEADALWQATDMELIELGESEMFKIGLVSVAASTDGTVLRVPKAYPGYFGAAFKQFDSLKAELDSISNLFLVGRNGMHRYNNQDHSMLTAAEAARQISTEEINKDLIWKMNIDDEYNEQK